MNHLPTPTGSRWQPLRLGLKNLYRYDDERFIFSGGRLLLRGNNGTGKTRVLALTLPFLLDGETRPVRVEPDGNPNKHIEWHLLMDKWHDRTGYTWIEFGRLEDGQPKYCTLGCGMRAVEGQPGLKKKWFFVTHRRIDEGFALADEGGVPLSQDKLEESLEGHGTVYETAERYRRAIDDVLFGLGERRYEALIKLLIALRRPQLSRDLDEAALSAALSDALSPLEDTVLDDLAEGYRELERDRDGLQAVESAAEAVAAFNHVHQREVKVHAGRLADSVRSTQVRYESAQGSVRAAQEARDRATSDFEEANKRLSIALSNREKAQGAAIALRASPEMRSAQRLARLREDRQSALQRAEYDDAEAKKRVADLRVLTIDAASADKRASTARAELLAAATSALASGIAVGIPAKADEEPAIRRQYLTDQLRSRRDAAKNLGKLDEAVRHAQVGCEQAAQRVHDEEKRRDEALSASEEADERLAKARQDFSTAVREHIASLNECRIDAELVGVDMMTWLLEPEEQDPLTAALATAAFQRLNVLAEDRAAQTQARELLGSERESFQAETERLRAGVDPGPPPPAWRDQSTRRNRAGAPLWRVVDFHADVDEKSRAGFEAALQASGLLDAWIHPGGQLEIGNDGDVHFAADASEGGECHLGSVLVPSIDPADPRDATLQVDDVVGALRAIGVRQDIGSCWVTAEGAWRNGPLQGAWTKPMAEHLGAGARATARRARLSVIASEFERIDRATATIDAAIAAIATAVERTESERNRAPQADRVRQPWHHAQTHAQLLAAARGRVAARQAEAAVRLAKFTHSQHERDTFAADCGLTSWIERGGELLEALAGLEAALINLTHAITTASDRSAEAGRATTRAQDGRTAVERADTRARASAGEESALSAELTELEATQGAAIADILRRLDETNARAKAAEDERTKADDAKADAREAIGAAGGAEREARTHLEVLTADRAKHIQALRAIVAEGLLAILGEAFRAATSTDVSDTRILDLARALAREIGDLQRDDAAVDRLQAQVNEAFQALHRSLSSSDMLPIGDVRHGIHLVRVPFQGSDRGTAELEGLLRNDAAQRRQLLTANERKVIENFLLDEAASHLHGLLHEAEKWLVTVNRELEHRPMSTGMALRFRWLPDENAPEGIIEARERLLRPSHAWSADDRDGLAAFLQRRISAAREDEPGTTWQEQLAHALDYRRWHRFVIDRRDHAGRWVRLTKRTHGTGSGGEKAVALTMPQFAAAAAHYQGSPHAPRLILLDEAFVGIDNDMRRNCLGLLAAFDLDVVMTSEREWGCYDTVPSLAIYQLASDPGGECIATTRYVWDGRQRTRDDQTS
jgi:uncharacterized protein (TIGR02680 family)